MSLCPNVVERTCRERRISLAKRCDEVDVAMSAIAELPLHVILAALLWLMAAGTLWKIVRRLANGLSGVDHPASAVRVVCGIRRGEFGGIGRRCAVRERGGSWCLA
jgi:hypothetical protein